MMDQPKEPATLYEQARFLSDCNWRNLAGHLRTIAGMKAVLCMTENVSRFWIEIEMSNEAFHIVGDPPHYHLASRQRNVSDEVLRQLLECCAPVLGPPSV
jgi:hypothetical protein